MFTIRHTLTILCFLLLSLTAITRVSATPIGFESYGTGAPLGVLGGYTMTSFAPDPTPLGTMVQSVNSPISGIVEFEDAAGDPLQLRPATVATWQGGNLWSHGYTGDVYVAPLPQINWIELIMPSDTQAFSFGVGASFNGTGWVEATNDLGDTYYKSFTVSPGSAKGFGFYTDTTECSQLTKIIVEPTEWAIGELAISQGECGTVTVPEPNILILFALGLIGIGYRSRLYRQK